MKPVYHFMLGYKGEIYLAKAETLAQARTQLISDLLAGQNIVANQNEIEEVNAALVTSRPSTSEAIASRDELIARLRAAVEQAGFPGVFVRSMLDPQAISRLSDDDLALFAWRFGYVAGDEAKIKKEDAAEYQVYVNDNFHYMDESERYSAGVFPDCETAKARCRGIVDEFLLSNHKEGLAADALLRLYKSYGEDPWISSPDGNCGFSAWDYAGERCEQICGGG